MIKRGLAVAALSLAAAPETGSVNLLVLAQTTKADAFADTGAADNGIFTTSNGSDWFYADSWSWGFKEIGAPFNKLQCSFTAPNASMCVHTLDFVGGFSINDITGLNDSQEHEKLVFVYTGQVQVPEPGTLAAPPAPLSDNEHA